MKKQKVLFILFVCLAAVFTLTMTGCELLGMGVLQAPTGVVVTLLSTGSLHVTWNAVDGADGYIINYRTNMDSSDTRRNAGSSTITTYTEYYWYEPSEVTTLYFYVTAYKGYYYASDRKDSEESSPALVSINQD